MELFETYFAQDSALNNITSDTEHNDHVDNWVDEGSISIYGHSGHCDSHADYEE